MADADRRRRYDDEDNDDRPRRRRRDEDDDDDDRPRRRPRGGSNAAAMASLILGILSFCLSALTGIPAVICGVIGLAKAKTTGTGQGMAIAGLVLGLAGTVLTATGAYYAFKATKKGVEKFADAIKTINDTANLAEVGKGMHNHNDGTGAFPAAAAAPAGQPGQPVRSWRLDLLPYVNEKPLFDRFDPAQPWDGPRNRAAADTPVRVYWPADEPNTARTRYRVFTGPNTPFPAPGRKPRLADFQDGMSMTILIADAAEVGPWAEPKDLAVTPTSLPALGRPNADRFVVVLADGSVKAVRKTIDPRVLRQLIDPKDGMILRPGWDQ
jgi:hypothetical protein